MYVPVLSHLSSVKPCGIAPFTTEKTKVHGVKNWDLNPASITFQSPVF